jgi:carbon-monoxide dehydrogenase medium subunit
MDGRFRPSAYSRPKSPEEAVAILSSHGDRARPLAGGTDLLARRPSAVEALVDIGFMGLSFILEHREGVRIGAATTVEALEHAPALLAGPTRALTEAAADLATPTIRNMATVGGNLCNASPGGDLCTALLAMDAGITVLGSKGSREIPIGRFFLGPNCTALEGDELLTEIRVPASLKKTGSSFLKIRRQQMSVDTAVVNVATRLTLRDGRCVGAAVSMGAVGPTPMRAGQAEALLTGRHPGEELLDRAAHAAMEEACPVDDVRGSADYRRRMVAVLVRNSLEISLRRCGA